jgi:hypothetical protein
MVAISPKVSDLRQLSSPAVAAADQLSPASAIKRYLSSAATEGSADEPPSSPEAGRHRDLRRTRVMETIFTHETKLSAETTDQVARESLGLTQMSDMGALPVPAHEWKGGNSTLGLARGWNKPVRNPPPPCHRVQNE